MPGTLHNVDFMVKDSKRFADSGGWGWAAFDYDAASDTFTPATLADNPPQGNDAKCGFACHTIVKAKDYVFTAYRVNGATVGFWHKADMLNALTDLRFWGQSGQ